MACYNREIMKNKSLMKAWRAAHLEKQDDGEEICLPEICNEIARTMRHDGSPRSRLSLRSCSFLLSGATRLYSQQLDLLLKDSSEEESFELMSEMEVADSSTSTGHSESTEYIPNDTESFTHEFDGSSPSDVSDESTVFTVTRTPNSNQQVTGAWEKSEEKQDQQIQTSPIPEPVDNREISEERKDQQTQTSPIPEPVDNREKSEERKDQQIQTSPIPEPVVDLNLPFGYTIVHDN